MSRCNVGRNISIILSIFTLAVSIILLSAPNRVIFLILGNEQSQATVPSNNNDIILVNIIIYLCLLLGGTLGSFAVLTLFLNWIWLSNIDSSGRETGSSWLKYELYQSRLVLICYMIFGFIFIIISLLFSNDQIKQTTEKNDTAIYSGLFIVYYILMSGCGIMILSSIGLLTSLYKSETYDADNDESMASNTDIYRIYHIDQELEIQNQATENERNLCQRFFSKCWNLCCISWRGRTNSEVTSRQNPISQNSTYVENTIPLLPIHKNEQEEKSQKHDIQKDVANESMEQSNHSSQEHSNNEIDPQIIENSANSNPTSFDRIKGTRRILQLASPQKKTLLIGCIVLLIRLPFSLSIPHLVSSTIGSLAKSDYSSAKQTILSILVLGTVDAILDFWCVYLFGSAKERMVKSLRLDTFRAILGQEMAFFDATHTGELTSRLTSDCGEMAGDLTWFFRFSIEATVRIVGISLYMLIRCPRLGGAALSIIPIVALVNKKYGNWLAKNATKVQTALAEANSVAQESFSCIRTVIAFATEDLEHSKYCSKINTHFRLNMLQLFATGIYYMVISTFIINTCIQATLLLLGSYLIQQEKLTVDVLLAFMLYQGQLQEYTLQFFQSYTSLIKSSGAGEKVFSLLDRTPNPPGTHFSKTSSTSLLSSHEEPYERNNMTQTIQNLSIMQEISLSHIHFNYPLRSSQPVLKNLNLTIPAGSTVALVGPSGCGKSTIISLLERFYEPTLGCVLIDGVDLRTLDLREYRRRVGIVAQDPVLFSGTILSNILYGSPCLGRSEAVKAAKLANVDSFVREFPCGYDTEVGEKGVQLSGGQKQRLAIARAIVKKPTLLLLDEATSALDQDSERAVQEAIDTLLQNQNNATKAFYQDGVQNSFERYTNTMTTVVVAHRLQTVRNADLIVVMQPGLGVVESGNHNELMAKRNGYYRRMVLASDSKSGMLGDEEK